MAQPQQPQKFPPLHIGCILYPGFQVLDLCGPLDALSVLQSKVGNLRLSFLAASLAPVSAGETPSTWPNATPRIGPQLVPTHTFAAPPDDLDMLVVPGGMGTRETAEKLQPIFDLIRAAAPRLQYLFSVCTGATLLSRAGVLDGRRATTNKRSWAWATAQGPNVNWVPQARWVVDGNIWTSSGVAAGIDAIYGWIGAVYGEDMSLAIANQTEYERHTDADWDPFSVIWDVPRPDSNKEMKGPAVRV